MAFDQEVVYQLKQKSSSTEGFLLREVNGSSSCAKYRGRRGGDIQGFTPRSNTSFSVHKLFLTEKASLSTEKWYPCIFCELL